MWCDQPTRACRVSWCLIPGGVLLSASGASVVLLDELPAAYKVKWIGSNTEDCT